MFFWQLILLLLSFLYLAIVAYYDWKKNRIPHGFSIAYVFFGSSVLGYFSQSSFLGNLVFAAVIFILGYFAVKKYPEMIGGGDVALIAALCLVLGLEEIIILTIIATLLGSLANIGKKS